MVYYRIEQICLTRIRIKKNYEQEIIEGFRLIVEKWSDLILKSQERKGDYI